MKIGLLRHGRTAWNDAGRLQGRTDVPLTEAERVRLSALGPPPLWRGAQVVASPLQRAVETARLVTQREPVTDNRLIEMDFGVWEGQRGAELLAQPDSGFRHLDSWGWDYRPPNGETPREVWERVLPALYMLGMDTLIVCHINVMRVVLAIAHEWNFDTPAPFSIKRNRIYGVEIRKDGGFSPMGEPTRLEAV